MQNNRKQFIGYCEKLPLHSGDRVTITKGIKVRCKGENKLASRTYIVTVHHVLNGYIPDPVEKSHQKERYGRDLISFNPKIVWPGSGGYWCEADINDIPEAQGGKNEG